MTAETLERVTSKPEAPDVAEQPEPVSERRPYSARDHRHLGTGQRPALRSVHRRRQPRRRRLARHRWVGPELQALGRALVFPRRTVDTPQRDEGHQDEQPEQADRHHRRPNSRALSATSPAPPKAKGPLENAGARALRSSSVVRSSAIPSHHLSTLSTRSIRAAACPRHPQDRSGRDQDGCGRAATGRRAGASTARLLRPPPSGDPGPHPTVGSPRRPRSTS